MKTIIRAFYSLFLECAALFVRLFGGYRHLDSLCLYAQQFNKLSKVVGKVHRSIATSYYRRYYRTFSIDNNLVFLDCFWGRKVGCHPYALYREIVKDKTNDWHFIWVVNKGVSVPADVSSNPNVSFVMHGGLAYAYGLLRAKVLICNSNFLPFFACRKDQIFVNTWHGIPLKNLGLDIKSEKISASTNTQRNFNQAHIIPMPSSWAADKVVAAYGASHGYKRVSLIGSPRIDLTLNSNPADIKNKVGIDDEKIILYAPTWRGRIGAVDKDLQIILNTIETIKAVLPEYVLYVSLHHLTKRALKAVPEGIKYVPDSIDINEFLVAVDILVSDYSSIFIDYLVLNRPVLLHVPDIESYSSSRGLLIDIDSLPITVTRNDIELREALPLLPKPSELNGYEYYRNILIPNEDGNASKRCWELVLTNIKENKNYTSEKSLLFYLGRLGNNGITNSFLSFVDDLIASEYSINIAFDATSSNRNRIIETNARYLIKNTNVVLVPKSSRMTFLEYLSVICLKYTGSVGLLKNVLDNYSYYEVRRALGDRSFDCFIDYTGYSAVWSLLAPNIDAKRKIVYLHSDMYAEHINKNRKMRYLSLVFSGYKNFDVMASVSSAANNINRLKLAKYITHNTKTVVTPSPFDGNKIIHLSNYPISDASANAAEFVLQQTKSTLFISIARLSPEKNLRFLLRAFAQLNKKVPDTALLIVGGGVLFTELKSLAKSLGVESKVCFTGQLSNPYPLLRASDCLVFPSIYEGQGLVLLEALTLGKFCIASKTPAAVDLLSNGLGYNVDISEDKWALSMEQFCLEKPKPNSFDYNAYKDEALKRFFEMLN